MSAEAGQQVVQGSASNSFKNLASEVAQASGAEEKGMAVGQRVRLASCAFDCGSVRPMQEMFRPGPRTAPTCYPCNNAKRALLQASKTAGAKEALDKLVEEDPELWKATVRGCRIVDPTANDPAGQTGMANMAARRQAVYSIVSSLTQTVGVSETGGRIWLKRSPFVARYVRDEGMEANAAAALFKMELQRPQDGVAGRRGQGGHHGHPADRRVPQAGAVQEHGQRHGHRVQRAGGRCGAPMPIMDKQAILEEEEEEEEEETEGNSAASASGVNVASAGGDGEDVAASGADDGQPGAAAAEESDNRS